MRIFRASPAPALSTPAPGWRFDAAGGLTLLRCDLLSDCAGLRHAFTTRLAGVSRPPYDALNLGLHVGDDPADVSANRDRLAAALGVAAGDLRFAEQVHGAAVACVAADRSRDDDGRSAAIRPSSPAPAGEDRRAAARREGARGGANPVPGVDALATADAGVALTVLAADCVPILMADPVRRIAAAVHAGWRGTVAGVATEAVRAMVALGAESVRIRAALGPAIGGAEYTVGAEVVTAVEAAWPSAAQRWLRRRGGDVTFDLAAANIDQLREAGVAAAHISACEVSTAGDPALWFSHRASGGTTGRQAGCVVWTA